MQVASRWAWCGAAAVALVALAVAGGLVTWRQRQAEARELRALRALQLPHSPFESPWPERSGLPVPRGVSSELPPWFGDRDAPPLRIAGRVVGARATVTVRLAIDVPDPGIWTGREVATTADGHFDFGAMRPGNYRVLATGDAEISRPTRVDTTWGPRDRVEVSVAPCQRFSGTVRKAAPEPRVARDVLPVRDARGRLPVQPERVVTPGAGLAIEVAGRLIGRTDAAGHYEVCAGSRDDLRLIAPGYESIRWFPHLLLLHTTDAPGVLQPGVVSSGLVLDLDGSRARRVGVQPVWRLGEHGGHVCVDATTVVTTDDEGRFSYSGDPRICGLRVFRGTTIYEATYPFTDDMSDQNPAAPSITPLATLHGEQLIVRLPGGGRADFERIGAQSLARP